MKYLGNLSNDQVELEIIECDCGFHIGLDATYIDQVDDHLHIVCPSCDSEICTEKIIDDIIDHSTIDLTGLNKSSLSKSEDVTKPKQGICKHCDMPIRLHTDDGESFWVHDDPDEDPNSRDYGWINCSKLDGEHFEAEPK